MIKVYLDSDVVIASMMSLNGASAILLEMPELVPVVSKISLQEIIKVSQKLNISVPRSNEVVAKLQVTQNPGNPRLFGDYVNDANDKHVVAGAVSSDCKHLLTFNLKDYKTAIILEKFDLVLMKPGVFLQYLRSRN